MRNTRLVVFLLAASSGCATTVGAGHAAVIWHARGGTDPRPLKEGLHFIGAWDQVELYDLRTQQHNEGLNVLAVNGLDLKLDTTIRYHIIPSEVSDLHREIGPGYYDTIIGPVLRSQARRVVGRYTPEEIYSSKRELIEREMREAVERAIKGKHLELEAILVRNVQLPAMIERAIMDKLSEEQSALKMKFVLEHEREEAERKKIEAEGIAAFQSTISARLTEAMLKWKQIEAMEKLAVSPNAKVVMMSGRDVPPVLVEPAK